MYKQHRNLYLFHNYSVESSVKLCTSCHIDILLSTEDKKMLLPMARAKFEHVIKLLKDVLSFHKQTSPVPIVPIGCHREKFDFW